MKPAYIETLKQIALRNGCTEYVVLSSNELGKILGISQQSASKRILELLKSGSLIRELGVRKQMLKLTPVGVENLRKEFFCYQRIFEFGNKLSIRSSVVTGIGEGQYYLNYKEYSDQFKRKLHFKPFEGTLNLKVSGSELSKIQSLRNMDCIIVRGFKKGGRTFGDVKCFPCRIKNIECAIIFPVRSYYNDVVEIISKFHLRRTLQLKDEDEVETIVNI